MFWPRNISLSIYLGILSFLSSMFYSFQHMNFVHMHFMVFNALVNSTLKISLLVYRNMIFKILILLSCDPSKLTLVLVAFYRLFGIFLNRKSCYLWIESFISLFQICMPFISLSCLIALARTSSTLLNRSGESGHPYLDFLVLEGKHSLLSMVLAVVLFFCRGPLSGWGSSLLFLVCCEFLSWMSIEFS